MRYFLLSLASIGMAAITIAAQLAPNELVAELYKAHRSKHDPLEETALLVRYFDPALLKLYLKDKKEAKGEVGRLDGDPLYNAQETEITDFSVSKPGTAGAETRVTVRFKNLSKPVRVVYMLGQTSNGWRVSDIRYDDGSSLKHILSGPL